MPRPRSRWFSRLTAGLALGAVLTAGGVAVVPSASAEEAPVGAQAALGVGSVGSGIGVESTWRELLDAALGDAGSALGVSFGSFNFASIIGGPIIAAIFGTDPKGPGITDVLKELDDIEHRLDEVQADLATIKTEIIDVKTDVLMTGCSAQTSQLTSYIASLKIAQSDYRQIVDEVENLRVNGGTGELLKIRIDQFISYTTGRDSPLAVDDSTFAQLIGNIHASMLKTPGNDGIIQGCGTSYLQQWRNTQTASSIGATAADAQGVWVDDRQYYEPVERMSRYWQSVQLQAMFLLQQASVMQASKLYVASGGEIAADETRTVCALAQNDARMVKARSVCNSGLVVSREVHENLVEEWRQIGIPFTDDEVVMTLGTDATGLANPGAPSRSALWARDPSLVPADWTVAGPTTNAAPVGYATFSDFLPADSTRWQDLEAGYRASHPGVAPAPTGAFDILGAMAGSRAPGDTATFTTSSVSYVWMPNETAAKDQRQDFNKRAPGMGMRAGIDNRSTRSIYYDNGFAIRCMVLPGDGQLCDPTSVGGWWDRHQQGAWRANETSVFTITPTTPGFTPLRVEMQIDSVCTSGVIVCGKAVSAVTPAPGSADPAAPGWLAPWTSFDGKVSATGTPGDATLWPVTGIPSCSKTSWGVLTRCNETVDAWLKANIPDPDVLGPQPAGEQDASISYVDDAGNVVCTVPEWRPRPDGSTSPVLVSDVTWLGEPTDGVSPSYRTALPVGTALNIDAFARDPKWAAREDPAFDLSCSYTARWADLASTTALQSAPVIVGRVGGGVGVGGPTDGPGATPSPAPIVSDPGTATTVTAGSSASGHSTGRLATTGTELAGGLWLGGALALLGLLLAAVGARRARRPVRR